MNVRYSHASDLKTILDIYSEAKIFMRKDGNPHQWSGSYPDKDTLLKDINLGNLYVIEDNDIIYGVFAFILGEDPTYHNIYHGKWLNNDKYGTIHRIASNGQKPNIFKICKDFCLSKTDNIRIDTHKDNKKMLETLKKEGFQYTGIIYLENGEERLAFQFIKKA
jgi:hypothetical protein